MAAADGRQIITISKPDFMCVKLLAKIARSRRLTRLRVTALPTRLLTTKPNRQCGKSLSRQHITRSEVRRHLPAFRTRAKERESRRRYCLFMPRSQSEILMLVLGLAMCKLYSDMFASAQATSFQDISTTGRLHSLAETMCPQSLSDFGLPGSLGHEFPLRPFRQRLERPAELY